ncbi:MAG: PAS domain S-box protein, partial [Thermosynechococcaceae cyanobacterium]
EHILADGNSIFVDFSIQPILDDARNVIMLIPEGRDISDRIRAEAALRQMNAESETRVQTRTEELLSAQTVLQASEEKFRQFAENLNQVFWMTEISKQSVLYINPAYEKIWGRSCASLYQDPSAWLTAIHPEDRERVRSLMPAQLQSECDVEYRILRPDGEVRWIRDRSFPIQNTEGQVYRIAGIAEDISEQKRVEEALQISEKRFRVIFEKAAIGMVQFTLDGKFIDLNQAYCNILGYSKSELLNKNFFQINYPGDIDLNPIPDVINYYLKMTCNHSSELRQIRKDGSIVWVNMSSSLVRKSTGEPYYFIGIIEDISGRKEAELRLQSVNEELERRVEERTLALNQAKEIAEAANHSKSIFLANMSHELRTPLNAILGFSQLLAEDSSLNSDQQENLRIINRSGAHLRTLINDVLDMSKIEVGRITLYEKDCDLKRMLTDLGDMFSLRAKERHLDLKVECESMVPSYIYADEIKLRQILINLLGNALKFTEKGHVVLRVWVESEILNSKSSLPQIKLAFAVEDTGIGILPEDINSIFKTFIQTRNGKNFQGGTGLGLPISDAFVRLMGGTISVTSQPAQGSCFWFAIPVGIPLACPVPETLSPHSILPMAQKFGAPKSSGSSPKTEGLQYPEVLSAHCVQEIPQTLLKDLYKALLECDVEAITLHIRPIQESSPRLFSHLTGLVDQFRFEDILALINPWIEAS